MTIELLVASAKSFLFVLATMLPILNPAATAPIFLSMTDGASPGIRVLLARRIARNMFWLMAGSMLIGSYVLDFFGISLPIVRVGGGLILASVAGGGVFFFFFLRPPPPPPPPRPRKTAAQRWPKRLRPSTRSATLFIR
jgi:hypothetical protein